MTDDRIEKEVFLRARLDRVWRAISDADEFGRWFGSASTARSSLARR
jgi:uncharacterized protein YndB with AHSA1/START domain